MTQTHSVFEGPVVVVGAGVAGLATAHLLAEAGAEVVVIEKLDTIGGLARSFKYHDEYVFDIGPHRFDVSNPSVKTYVERVLQRHSTFFPRKSEVYFEGDYYDWPIKPQNLVQLPPALAAKAFVDLALNGYKTYPGDNFQTYILKQYGPTLYQNFFEGYSLKFLGIHPKDTHTDWAKVGINRAIINDNAQMQNLTQLLKSTLMQFNKKPERYIYPRGGMQQAWVNVAELIEGLGGRIITGVGARMERSGDKVSAVHAGDERFEPSVVVWTAPITLAAEQLEITRPDLEYLGLLLFNVMVHEDCPRDYQWCYYGARELLLNRVSIPRFFCPQTAPAGTTGYCCEVTSMVGDERWKHGERLTDWIIDDLVKVDLIRDRSKVFDVRIERIPESYPVYRKNYPEELAGARQALGQISNLHLAGRTGLFWYNNMDHSLENATQLARRLLRDSGRQNADEAALAAGLPIGA